MPPKKAPEPERKPLIGRVGTNLRVGIVGIPNVGKSTFFNVLTKSSAAAENFPFCTIDPNENKFHVIIVTVFDMFCNLSQPEFYRENNALNNITLDQTVIFKKKYLKYLSDFKNEEQTCETTCDTEWYPCVNSYYQFTEDVDAFARVNHLLETKRSFASVHSEDKQQDECNQQLVKGIAYSEHDAHLQYLYTKPISFLILGKPKIGEKFLGNRLANYWKCVHIEPQGLIEEEIQSGSRAGQCIEFNLRCGRSVGIDIILRLLLKKLKQPRILHRGFVISGFPLIPNGLFEEDPICSESAIFTVKEIFDEVLERTFDMTNISRASFGEESHSVSSITYKDDNHSLAPDPSHVFSNFNYGETESDIDKQLNGIFDLFSDPFMIIYITCNNNDVVTKRNYYYFDIYAEKMLDMQKVKRFLDLEPHGDDFIQDILDFNYPFGEVAGFHHLAHVPEDFPAHVATQLDRFHNTVVNAVDYKLLLHNQSYYVKVDGRTSISTMFELVKTKLSILPLNYVLVPQKLYEETVNYETEQRTVTLDDADLLPHEAFKNYAYRHIVNPLFKWTWSDWKVFCPVAMKDYHLVKGKSKYGVQFFNKIFFCSSEEALTNFIENPRDYIKWPYPKPCGRIMIFGPPVSGKTVLAQCLHYLWEGVIINPHDIIQEYQKEKIDEMKEKLRQEAILEALQIINQKRLEEYEMKKAMLEDKIMKWQESVRNGIMELQSFIESKLNMEVSPHGVQMIHSREAKLEEINFNNIIRLLQDNNIEPPKTIEECKRLLDDDNAIMEYMPKRLTEHISPPLPALPTDPFVKAHADRAVTTSYIHPMHINYETEIEIFMNAIAEVKTNNWIIDGMSTNMAIIEKVCETHIPEYVVILQDPPDGEFLFNRLYLRSQNKFPNWRQFFLSMEEKDAICRYTSTISEFQLLSMLGEDSTPRKEQTRPNYEEYKEEVARYHKELPSILDYFHRLPTKLVDVLITDLTIEDIMREVINSIRDDFRENAMVYMNEDKALDVKDFLSMQNMDSGVGGEAFEGGGDLVDFEKSQRYGETFRYCPVTFYENFVLWEGRDDFAARFNNKLYLCQNTNNLTSFLKFPTKYTNKGKPPEQIPPPRICVIGPHGSGKTQISKALAQNFGVRYIDYDANIQHMLTTTPSAVFGEDHDKPSREIISKTLINQIWFEEPIRSIGFILDDFPKTSSDINIMVEYKAIPDLVINLSAEKEYLCEKLLEFSLNHWREQMEEQKKALMEDFEIVLIEWRAKIDRRYKLLREKKRQERYAERICEKKFGSQVSIISVEEQEDEKATWQQVFQEFPEPVFKHTFESEILARDRLNADIIRNYLDEIGILGNIKELCTIHLIPFKDINANMNIDKIILNCFHTTEYIRGRNESFFEQCFDITPETAELLLEKGYYFLSSFGRTCPVQYYENEMPIQMYLPLAQKLELCPLIYRYYIIYLASPQNVEKFKQNPLKYMRVDKVNFPLVPFKVAIIGPPKSGKTSLANRFRLNYGFKVLTRGAAARYTLEKLPVSELAKSMEALLSKGKELQPSMVMSGVYAASFDTYAITQGIILDGFPNDLEEINLLKYWGLVPNLIINLCVADEDIAKFSQRIINPRQSPIYSKRFTKQVFERWLETASLFQDWCDREYQNIYNLKVNKSLWGVWEESKVVALAIFNEIHHYHKNIADDWPLRLSNMLVTPLEFLERQSKSYKTYCPVCVKFNQFSTGGEPPNRLGLVQFRNAFYWLCQDHIDEFLDKPEAYIPPYNQILPEEVPKRIIVQTSVNLNESCIVCYVNNLPERVLRKVNINFAVSYHNKIYLFDTEKCLEKFLRYAKKYSQVQIHFTDASINFPLLDYSELPCLGLLEQYVADQLVKAINHICIHRPIIPGLSIELSALIGIGLYLKVWNPKTPFDFKAKYEESLKRFHQKSKDLMKWLEIMKSYMNPYLEHVEHDELSSLSTLDSHDSAEIDSICGSIVSELVDDLPIENEEDIQFARRVPVPDDRFEYLCEYFKPVSKVPAFLNVVDIAGLVKGASEGQGLGNAFLSHISACDAIFHLCRAFEDDDVTHVEGDINPVRDLDIIAEELRLKDDDTLMKNLEKLERTVCRGGDKKLKPEYDTLVKIKSVLVDEKKHIRFGDWDVKDIEVLNKYLFLTSKPTIYLVNLAEKDYIKKKNKWLIKIKEWVDKNDPGALIIPFSGGFEQKLLEEYEDPALRKKFLEENNVTSALDKIIVQGYKALQLEYFFTAGPDEVKAWTIQKGTKAPQAAGRIHTDFEKGFIMAEVMKFSDFKEEGSETACKAAGKYRQQGRNYVVEDGDIIFFKFNAGAGLKDAKKK